MDKNGLVKKDACNQMNWRGVVKAITIQNLSNSVDGEKRIRNVIDDDDDI